MPSLRALLRERYQVVGRGHPAGQAAGPLAHRRSSRRRSRRRRRPPGIPVLQPDPPAGRRLSRRPPPPRARPRRRRRLRPYPPARGARRCPALGMINVHASLLPRWRGAAPIQHAILAGDRGDRHQHHADGGGPRQRPGAAPGRDARSATTRPPARSPRGWPSSGATALVEALSLLAAGLARPEPQDDSAGDLRAQDRPGAAPASTGRRDAAAARAPGARVRSRARRLDHARRGAGQAVRRRRRPSGAAASPGSVLAAGDRLVVACGDGALAVREAQPAGRTRLAVGDWVRGPRHRGRGDGSRETAAPAARRSPTPRVLARRRFRRPRGGDRGGRPGGGAARARPHGRRRRARRGGPRGFSRSPARRRPRCS